MKKCAKCSGWETCPLFDNGYCNTKRKKKSKKGVFLNERKNNE